MSETSFDVFMSHSSKDHKQAKELVRLIEKANHSCWYAPRNIHTSQDYSQVIHEVMGSCRSIVVLLSEHSLLSPNVRAEIRIAFDLNIPIFPIKIDHCQPEKNLMYHLGGSQWLDAISKSDEEIAKTVIAGLEKRGSGTSREPIPEPKPVISKVQGVLAVLIVTVMVYFIASNSMTDDSDKPISDATDKNESDYSQAEKTRALIERSKPTSQWRTRLAKSGWQTLEDIPASALSLRFNTTSQRDIDLLLHEKDGNQLLLDSAFAAYLRVHYSADGNFTQDPYAYAGEAGLATREAALASGKLFVRLSHSGDKESKTFEIDFDPAKQFTRESLAYWQEKDSNSLKQSFCYYRHSATNIPRYAFLNSALQTWQWGTGSPSDWYTQDIDHKALQSTGRLHHPQLMPLGSDGYSIGMKMSDGSMLGPVDCLHPNFQGQQHEGLMAQVKAEGSPSSEVPTQLKVIYQFSNVGWTGLFPVLDGAKFFAYELGDYLGDNQSVGKDQLMISAKAKSIGNGQLKIDYILEDGTMATYRGLVDSDGVKATRLQAIKTQYFDKPKLVCHKVDREKIVQCGLPSQLGRVSRNFVEPAEIDDQLASVSFDCGTGAMDLSDDFSKLGGRYLLFTAPYDCRQVSARYTLKDGSQSGVAKTVVLPLPSLLFGRMQKP